MRYRLRAFAAAAVILGSGGCATNVSTPESVRQSASGSEHTKPKATDFVTVKAATKFFHDRHIGARTATGPQIKYLDPQRNKLLDGYNIYNIIAIDVGRSGPDVIDYTDIQIRVRQTTYGDWAHFQAAYSEGTRFDITRVDSDVNCLTGSSCSKTEVVGIDMSMDALRSMADRPVLAFKVAGTTVRTPNLTLVKRILRAMAWLDQIKLGMTISEIATAENVTSEYITHNLGLSFLSPRVLKAIVAGNQRPEISAYQLSKIAIPEAWDEQDAIFLERN